MSPVDYHGWTHAPKEQGGTDPIPITPGASLGHAYIKWNGSTVSVPADTWSNIDATALGNADWGEGFESDPNPHALTVTLTKNLAQIEWDGPGTFQWPLVLVTGWVQYSDSGFADGDEIGVGLRTGISGTFNNLYINTVPVGGDPADIRTRFVTVSAIFPGAFNVNSVKLNAWQSSGGAKNLSDAFLSVTSLMDWAGTFYP